MDEGETLETESNQASNPTSEKGSEYMTFEELKEKAWQEAEPALLDWKNKLGNFQERKAPQIDQAITNIASLYGKPVPEKDIIVNLNYFPEKDRESGEPAVQDDKDKSFDPKTGNVVYFVSERTMLPTDTEQDIADMPVGTVSRIIHETEHALFQDDDFKQLIEISEQVPEINKTLDKIISSQEHYTEFTNELITTYLDSYAHSLLQKQTEIKSDSPKHLKFVVDKENFGEVLEKVVKSDVEVWRQNGPRTDLRVAWEKRLGNLPKGYESKPKDSSIPSVKEKNKIPSVYEIGSSLDLALVKRYVSEGRKMDVEFVTELYKMVNEKIYEIPEV